MIIKDYDISTIRSVGDLNILDSKGNPQIIVTPDGVRINRLDERGRSQVTSTFQGQPNYVLDQGAINALNTQASIYSIVSRGTGSVYSRSAGIYNSLTGEPIFTQETKPAATQGYNVAVMDRYSRKWVSFTTYDIETTASLANTMATALNALTNSVVIFIFTIGDAELNRNDNLKDAIVRCGGSYGLIDNMNFATDAAYMLVGIPDSNEGSGIESYNEDTGSDDNWIDNSVTEAYGQITSGPLTLRDTILKSKYAEDVWIKQVVSNYQGNGDNNVTSAVTWATVIEAPPITTTGGTVLITANAVFNSPNHGAGDIFCKSGIFRNTTVLTQGAFMHLPGPPTVNPVGQRNVIAAYKEKPAAGTYTYKLRGVLYQALYGYCAYYYLYIDVMELTD